MRTAPIALAYLHDPQGMAQAAASVSALTHHDRNAGEACAAVVRGDPPRRAARHPRRTPPAVEDLPPGRRAYWRDRLAEAEAHPPAHFTNNGWVVAALQGAWSAITHTPIPDPDPAAGVFPAQSPAARSRDRGPRWQRHRHRRGDRRRAARRRCGGPPPCRWPGSGPCTAGPGTGPGT